MWISISSMSASVTRMFAEANFRSTLVRPSGSGGANSQISGNFAAHFTLRSCQLTLRLPVNLQNPRKIVPKGRPLEVLQSAEKRRLNLICGAGPEGVGSEIHPAPTAHEAEAIVIAHALNFSNVVTQRHGHLGLQLTKEIH
jgi:hypothetical protein